MKIVAEQSALHLGDPVSRLIGRAPVFVQRELTLRQVSEVLAADAIGAVLVRSHGGFCGVVSERDVVLALADGADPDLDRADDVMTDDVATVDADTTIGEVADLMLANEIRHVPVVEDGVAVGIVSFRDVVRIVRATR